MLTDNHPHDYSEVEHELGLAEGSMYPPAELTKTTSTNKDELARIEGLLSHANANNLFSVMSSYENRIKRLRLLVSIENKIGKPLPKLPFSMDFSDYLRKDLGYKGPIKLSRLGGLANATDIADFIINSQSRTNGLDENKVAEKTSLTSTKPGDQLTLVLDDDSIVTVVRVGTDKNGEPTFKHIENNKQVGTASSLSLSHIKSIKEESNFKSGREFINTKLRYYPKALAKVNNLINMIGENNFTMDMAEWIFDFFNNASFESPVSEESLQEGYARFRNETKTRTKPEQFHSAVKEVKKKVNEINRIFEYMSRLQNELKESEGGLKTKKYTENALNQIKEATKQLFFKSTKLK